MIFLSHKCPTEQGHGQKKEREKGVTKRSNPQIINVVVVILESSVTAQIDLS